MQATPSQDIAFLFRLNGSVLLGWDKPLFGILTYLVHVNWRKNIYFLYVNGHIIQILYKKENKMQKIPLFCFDYLLRTKYTLDNSITTLILITLQNIWMIPFFLRLFTILWYLDFTFCNSKSFTVKSPYCCEFECYASHRWEALVFSFDNI